ncbi:MAG TPA: hypothetical protein PKE69_27335 [Pyrinomonadaceae bacterium]|nr:hypothetical protein [Pyrinomonadaceae bacterium]
MAKSPQEIYPNLAPAAIEHAFNINGEDYYKFSSELAVPHLRAFKCMQLIGLAEANISHEKAKKHSNACLDYFDKGETSKLGVQLWALHERLNWSFDEDAAYGVAACIYFDKNENINDYDEAYGRKKIELWKKHGGADFFLQRILPLSYGHLTMSAKNLALHLAGQRAKEKATAIALESYLVPPSETPPKPEQKSYLKAFTRQGKEAPQK